MLIFTSYSICLPEIQWAGSSYVEIYSWQQRCVEGQTQTEQVEPPLQRLSHTHLCLEQKSCCTESE